MYCTHEHITGCQEDVFMFPLCFFFPLISLCQGLTRGFFRRLKYSGHQYLAKMPTDNIFVPAFNMFTVKPEKRGEMYHSPPLGRVALRPRRHVFKMCFSEKCHLYNKRSDALTFSKKQTSLSEILPIPCLSRQKNSPVNIYSLVVCFLFDFLDDF